MKKQYIDYNKILKGYELLLNDIKHQLPKSSFITKLKER